MLLRSPALRRWQQRRAFNARRRAAFYADMARFSEAGIPSFRAVEKMAGIAKRRRHHHLEAIYKRIMDASVEGGSIAAGLIPEVPGAEAVMLSGAVSGGAAVVQRVLREMAGLLDRQVAVNTKLRKVLLINGLTLSAIVGVIAVIMVVVVPQLQAGTTPEMAGLMHFAPLYFSFGEWFLRLGPAALILSLGVAGWVAWSLPRWHVVRPYWRRAWFDRHLLPWTFYARMQSTFLLSTVATMMQSGLPMRDVLTSMQSNATPWMRAHLRRMLRTLGKGETSVEAMNSGLLPQDTADRLAVYSLIPDATTVMQRLAEDNFTIYESSIDAVAGVLRTISILLLAVFILCTLFAIFDFSNAVVAGSKASGI